MAFLRLATSLALSFACSFAVAAAAPPEPEKLETPPVPAPQHFVTHHRATIGGTSIAYTATTGTIVLKNAKGQPDASVFYTAYVKDGERPERRPITFMYNGGPGSSSAWLHMLSFGPRRVAVTNAGLTPAAPYAIVDNDESLLDRSDLVFIDAIGTGFSRIVGSGKPDEFYGIDQDARAFAQTITRYVTINDRWNSPKYLFGESYGTTRSAALVDRLQNAGMDFRGVVLLSSILNFTFDQTETGDDAAYPLYLPTQAAVAAYHHALAQQPSDLPAFLAGVRAFALGDYTHALAQGSKLSASERDRIATTLAADTGLSKAFIDEADLRVSNDLFEKQLLRSQRRVVGRLDGRYLGIPLDRLSDAPDYDPTDPAITGPVTAAFNRYVRGELGYKTNDDYHTTAYADVNAKWDFRRSGDDGTAANGSDANVMGDLKEAMTKNTLLHVFSANGYYDFATPFFATEYTLDHLLLDPTLIGNITYGYYRSGHMVYLDPLARRALKNDLARFYTTTSP